MNPGGNLPLDQVFWYNSTISLPLDTISIFVSEYSNTTITSTSTIYGNITSLSANISAQARSAQSDSPVFIGGGYQEFGQFVLANGTDGAVPGGVTNFPYPTPYIAVAAFSVFTNLPSAGCPLGSPQYITSLISTVLGPQGLFSGVGVVTVDLISTFYAPLPISAASNFFGNFDLNTESFSAFLASNTSLLSYMPYLTSCSYITIGFGPPALQIPAMVLTTTMRTTVKENSPHPTNPPKPGSPIGPSVPPQTTRPAQGNSQGSSDQSSPDQGSSRQGPPDQSAPGQGSSTQGPPNPGTSNQGSSNPKPGTPDEEEPSQDSPNQGSSNQGSPNPNVNPNPGSAPAENVPGTGNQGVLSQGPVVPQALSPTKDVAAPPISYAGTTIQPNEASQYDLPGIGTLSPGGPDVTTNGIIYSLLPSVTALVSNGFTIPIRPVGDAPAASPQPGILSFKGASYTADAASRFVIAGQTITPAGPAATISGTPIKIAPGATAAVIGTIIVPIVHNPAVVMPSVAPVLTFAGSVYTAGASSAFVIEGQTLTPGANIEVQGTQISYPSGGTEIVVGTSTEQLSFATITPPVVAPVITFDGSTYTADSSSQFIIDGQTLALGKAITVSGTPISYAAAGSAIVVGTSTEPLSYAEITPTAAVITFDGSTYTADASSDFIINGQTLAPGGMITVSGTPISYNSAGSAVVIGSSTESFSYAKITSSPAVITFDGSTYTADTLSDFIINGQTLAPGGVITVSGTPISYASGGTDVVIGTSTEAVGIGGLIMSGFSGGGGPAKTDAVEFTGGAVGAEKWSSALLGTAVVVSLCSVLLL